MIKRIWRGWTRAENADPYQHLLDETIVPGIIARQIDGLIGVEVLRSRHDDRDDAASEVEFITVMVFDTWEAVKEFAGGDCHGSVVPPEARELLSRFETHSTHFDAVAHHRA